MNIQAITEEIEKVSEKYTNKFEITKDSDWYILKLQEELGELIQSYLMMIGQARAKGKNQDELVQDFHREVADVFCHILLLAKHHQVDIEKEVADKWLVWNEG
jgi:NTP pyrophosphatase (non-canonical NTP hydrolase)